MWVSDWMLGDNLSLVRFWKAKDFFFVSIREGLANMLCSPRNLHPKPARDAKFQSNPRKPEMKLILSW